jgi:hypothetical protein
MVVPLDGSTLAEAALPVALELAGLRRAHLGDLPETHPARV